MSKDFNYKDFVDQLRFQVRGVIPEKQKDSVIYVRYMVYQMSILAAEELYNDENINEANCKYITQVIAEWTFHKTIDMISCNIPNEYHEAILHKINHEIFKFLLNVGDAGKPEVINKVEKLVNKTYKKALFMLFEKKCINKSTYNKALKQSNIDEMSAEQSEDVYTIPVSIWDVLKVHPYITLAYLFALTVIFATMLCSFFKGDFSIGIAVLILFALFLFRFLTRESEITITLPEDK